MGRSRILACSIILAWNIGPRVAWWFGEKKRNFDKIWPKKAKFKTKSLKIFDYEKNCLKIWTFQNKNLKRILIIPKLLKSHPENFFKKIQKFKKNSENFWRIFHHFFFTKWGLTTFVHHFGSNFHPQAKVGFIPNLADGLKMPENGSRGWSWLNFKCGHVFDPQKAQNWPKTAKEFQTSRSVYGFPGP